jgi:glycosyltransferase involved in cell wall biosynthesis
MATHARDMQNALATKDIQVDIEEASSWIPNETGPRHDKSVSKKLRQKAEGYDVVHAFGYRSAWACSAAFGHKEAWVYTAYDIPKTTHRVLISNLNDAQTGICVSRAVYRALDEAIAIDLTTICPGVRPAPQEKPDKEEARRALGLPATAIIVGGLGRLVPERGFRQLVEAMGIVWAGFPEAVLAIAGDGPEKSSLESAIKETHRPDQIKILGPVPDAWKFLAALDLCVIPSTRAGFSMVALEAMALGGPVMVRNTGGLTELVETDISGFVFRADEELGQHISEVLDLPLTLQTVGAAGRIRATETFNLEPCVEGLVEIYKGIVSGD